MDMRICFSCGERGHDARVCEFRVRLCADPINKDHVTVINGILKKQPP